MTSSFLVVNDEPAIIQNRSPAGAAKAREPAWD